MLWRAAAYCHALGMLLPTALHCACCLWLPCGAPLGATGRRRRERCSQRLDLPPTLLRPQAFEAVKARTSTVPFQAIWEGRQQLPQDYYKVG